MKTIDLSEAKARTLLGFLAPEWARLAVHIAASNVEVSTPLRLSGEGLNAPAFKRRVTRRKAELAAIGDVLVALGATLPAVNREAFVSPYRSPSRPRRKYTQYRSGAGQVERGRIAAAILASISE